MKKLTILCLLFTGTSLLAGEPSQPLRGEGLSFKRNASNERNFLKVKNTSSGASFMKEEDRESHGPGFFVNFGLFMPGADYMNPWYIPEFNSGYALEAGNYFRFFNTERIGLGLRATWMQLGYTTFSDTSIYKGNAWGSPLRLGPQLSVLITEDIGMDVFYQLGAQYNITWYNGENMSLFGISHEAGLNVRWKIFTLGAAMKFGAFKNIDVSDPTNWPKDTFFLYPAGGMRIFVGVQL